MKRANIAVRSNRAAVLLLVWVGLGTPSVYGQDFVSIFDGSSLKGWTTEHTTARVREGVLVLEKGSGWVRNEQVLADFVLRMDVRLVGPDAKAGVFLRAWPTFDQFSVPNNGFRLMAGPSGTPTDAWQRFEIECIGSTARVHVDGVLVHTAEMIDNPQGYIALVTAAGVAEFKAIEVRKIARPRRERGPTRQRDDGAFLPGEGLQNPRVRREVKPQYTAAAMAARIQGTVLMEAVVLADGTVGETAVLQSLDPKNGLDREAEAALKAWRFVPGNVDGRPVAVLVTVEMTFTLK